MDDDLYPSDGEYFLPREPKDQKIARSKERAKTLEAAAILEDVVIRLTDRIAFYEANSSIPEDVRDDPQKFLIMSNSHLLAARTLTSEREYIQSLIDAHIPSRWVVRWLPPSLIPISKHW